MTKSIFVVERTAGGFKYTRGPANDAMVTAIVRHLGNRSPTQAALEEGKAWLLAAPNLGFAQVEVTIEW